LEESKQDCAFAVSAFLDTGTIALKAGDMHLSTIIAPFFLGGDNIFAKTLSTFLMTQKHPAI